MNGFAVRALPYLLAFLSSLCIMILELVASRLVARHVGGSLTVWTSVIGIMLGGICLGNVLGGKLADRIEPRRAIGPLYALGAALTLGCLWMNAAIGLALPTFGSLPWDLRTLVVVTLDFLIPATVLGMISPVVAKMAVDQARKAGSALGLIYFLGAVGSIVGTFIAGFYLIYLAGTSAIVAVVAAALALLAAAFHGGLRATLIGLGAAVGLALGATLPMAGIKLPGITVDSTPMNVVSLVGQVLTLTLATFAWGRLRRDVRESLEVEPETEIEPRPKLLDRLRGAAPKGGVDLTDLAALSFVASLAFMALEMVAGRLVTRHLGSSIYGWTSVIGVLLGGLSLGNFLGGKAADRITKGSQASWLFLMASVLTAAVLLAETPPAWLIRNPIGHWRHGVVAVPLFGGDGGPALSQAISMTYAWIPGLDLAWHKVPMPWWGRLLFWTTLVFLLPSIAMGTVSPVVAKLAVERLRQSKRTGQAIGQVYAWGMVGSIVGTFLAGFILIDLVGTKGMLLILATVLALAATSLGSIVHAAWAGIPLGLCVIAFLPFPWFERQGLAWGLREDRGNLSTEKEEIAYTDESNYYFIKVLNEPDPDGRKRTLVLDNLIHGYGVLDHPERLDYDYEHVYSYVTRRIAESKAKAEGLPATERAPLSTLFLGGGSYTFPRYLKKIYPNTRSEVAEIDPAVTRANRIALGLTPEDEADIKTTWGDARQYVVNQQGKHQFDIVFGDAFNDFSVPWHLTTKQFNEKLYKMLSPDGVYMINIIDIYKSDERAMTQARTKLKEDAAQAASDRVIAKAGGADKADPDEIDRAEEAARIDPETLARAETLAKAEARSLGGFLGSWVNTAKQTFPHVYVFGTDTEPGYGLRETFVVVASKRPLKLDDLGERDGDPSFFTEEGEPFRPRPYSQGDMDALAVRSRGIVLTDDYAPVENLLAPVAATRGEDD
ncbi:MAG: fused MFS/spermidine synthase [Isosphaeraceae bacterium]